MVPIDNGKTGKATKIPKTVKYEYPSGKRILRRKGIRNSPSDPKIILVII